MHDGHDIELQRLLGLIEENFLGGRKTLDRLVVEVFDAPSEIVDELLETVEQRLIDRRQEPEFVRYASILAVLLAHDKRWDAVLRIRDEVGDDSLVTVRAAVAFSAALDALGRMQAAVDVATDIVGRHPRSKPALKHLYGLLKASGSTASSDDLLLDLQTIFPPSQLLNFVQGLQRGSPTSAEIDHFISELPRLDRRVHLRAARFFAKANLDEEQRAELEVATGALPAAEAHRLRIALWRAEDEIDVDRLLGTPLSMERFHDRRDAVQAAEAGAALGAERLPIEIAAKAAAHALYTRESYADALALATALRGIIETGTPAHFVRLGIDEGATVVEARSPETAADTTFEAASSPAPSRPRALVDDLARVVRDADVIGVPPVWQFRESRHQESLGAIAEFVAEFSVVESTFVTSAAAHFDLLRWGLWPLVLNGVASVSVIAAVDLAPVLDREFSLGVRQMVLTPQTPDGLTDRLDVLPGEVWLIAAGPAGIWYGHQIREQGGIALDVGEVCDYWLGKRSGKRSVVERIHNLPLSLARGHGITWVDKGPPPPDGPMLSNTHLDGFVAKAQNPIERDAGVYRFKAIGHPRSGSGSIARLLQRFGYDVGHERLRADGICSWMSAVPDQNPPWGHAAVEGDSFDHVIGFVRDPFETIPSVLIENGVYKSFMFRRLHILHQLGIDIANYDSPLERATASVIHWDRIVRDQIGTDTTIRVEQGESMLVTLLNRFGLAATDGGADDDQAALPTNSTIQRIGQPKPTLSITEYRALAPELYVGLAEYCSTYGYEFRCDQG